MSAIYEYLGARPDQIAKLWIAAPLTGLLVQPIIGALSERTWGSNDPDNRRDMRFGEDVTKAEQRVRENFEALTQIRGRHPA